jgi:hypothetical protein
VETARALEWPTLTSKVEELEWELERYKRKNKEWAEKERERSRKESQEREDALRTQLLKAKQGQARRKSEQEVEMSISGVKDDGSGSEFIPDDSSFEDSSQSQGQFQKGNEERWVCMWTADGRRCWEDSPTKGVCFTSNLPSLDHTDGVSVRSRLSRPTYSPTVIFYEIRYNYCSIFMTSAFMCQASLSKPQPFDDAHGLFYSCVPYNKTHC